MDHRINHTVVPHLRKDEVNYAMSKADISTFSRIRVDLCFYWSQCHPSVILSRILCCKAWRYGEDVHSNTNSDLKKTYLFIL